MALFAALQLHELRCESQIHKSFAVPESIQHVLHSHAAADREWVAKQKRFSRPSCTVKKYCLSGRGSAEQKCLIKLVFDLFAPWQLKLRPPHFPETFYPYVRHTQAVENAQCLVPRCQGPMTMDFPFSKAKYHTTPQWRSSPNGRLKGYFNPS